MSFLRISLFGDIQIAREGESASVKTTHTVGALLAYLLLNRQRQHSRHVLAGLFWGDCPEDQARSCLNTALWRLRGALEREDATRGTFLVTSPAGEVGINREAGYWLDIEAFETSVHLALGQPVDSMQPEDCTKLEEALGLYKGDLLEGFYDDWALRERERLRGLYLKGLSHFMHYYEHCRNYEKALKCGQRILDSDPLREEVHREMMRLYMANGQRALAVRQYEICREALRVELGISPMQETRLLRAQILDAGQQPTPESGSPEEPFNPHNALQQLRLSIQGLDVAREQLILAMRLVERFTEHRHP